MKLNRVIWYWKYVLRMKSFRWFQSRSRNVKIPNASNYAKQDWDELSSYWHYFSWFIFVLTRILMCVFRFFVSQNNMTSVQEKSLSMCNEQLAFGDGKLINMLQCLNAIIHDDSFIQQLLAINQDIYNLGQVEEWQSTDL